jgi:hypothetical protein
MYFPFLSLLKAGLTPVIQEILSGCSFSESIRDSEENEASAVNTQSPRNIQREYAACPPEEKMSTFATFSLLPVDFAKKFRKVRR